jgi:ABC-type Na+ efflux pump permease subunit
LARFGSGMFRLLAPLQLLVLASLAAVGSSSSVAQEKDRRTLLLLLMTRLSGGELVLGKCAASLLGPLAMLAVALPLFLSLPLLGGVSLEQIALAYAITFSSVLFAAAVGTVVGLWREKTFQAIATTVLILVLYVVTAEIVGGGRLGAGLASLTRRLNPITAMGEALSPLASAFDATTMPVGLVYATTTTLVALLVVALGITRVRVWNPSREVRFRAPEPETGEDLRALQAAASSPADGSAAASELRAADWRARAPRRVWSNPVLWREVCTWAYGRKIILVRIAFVALFCATAGMIVASVRSGDALRRFDRLEHTLPVTTLPVAAIGVISLVLVNALAVNSVTGERDGLALDLLMVTDLQPSEFVFGKLLGVFYVAKEMILLPLVLVVYLGYSGAMTWENATFSILGAIVLYLFVSMLGIHTGLSYLAGRTATLVSLGTVFFLCVGVAICMVIMVSFRGAFQLQLAPFLAMILGGGAALFAALGWRTPSSAIFVAAFLLPLITFYSITQFLLQRDQLFVFATIVVGYGFTTAAMLIPALSEFDVSLDRDSGGDGGEA